MTAGNEDNALAARVLFSGEVLRWVGRAGGAKSGSALVWTVVLIILVGAAVQVTLPHLQGAALGPSLFVALILVGTLACLGVPLYLRWRARSRGIYIVTNRRALLLSPGGQVLGEAALPAGEVHLVEDRLEIAPARLDWRLRDEREDRLRFEGLPDRDAVATLLRGG